MALLILQIALALLSLIYLTTSVSSAKIIQKRANTNPGPAGWNSIGCYTDQAPRTLTQGKTSTIPGATTSMTVALCTAACNDYTYAGLEYAQECWCGNAISNGGAPATSGCSMTCKGNATEYCGGSNRLNVYQSGPLACSASSSISTTSSTSSISSILSISSTSSISSFPISSSTSSALSAVATSLPSGWSYKDCYIDNANGRILTKGLINDANLTNEKCVAECQSMGYSVAGTEYSTQCYCDNAVINGGKLATSETECNIKCGGNAAENCGAGNRMSIHAQGNLTAYDVPVQQKTGLPGKWGYQGCLAEAQGGKIWKYQTILTNNNSATECLSRCSQFGFVAGGMEYGTECYCGDVIDINIGGSLVADGSCSTTCPGDPRYLCGSGSRLSYYAWNLTDPLYKWNYPNGTAAGKYKLFIGGVVVPLIRNLGINGKVTFVEKHGTGATNSAGAYGLDPSQINSASNVKLDFVASGWSESFATGRQEVFACQEYGVRRKRKPDLRKQ